MQPNVSIAAVELHYRLNANLLRRWVAAREELDAADEARQSLSLPAAEFVPLQLEAPGRGDRDGALAAMRCGRLRNLVARVAAVIRIEAIWLATEPIDMRAGVDTILARVVKVFGAARPHHAYLFANRHSTRLKVLVYDGFGIWLAARRLNKGRFIWTNGEHAIATALNPEQLRALVTGLPWQTLTRVVAHQHR
ncbi:IS66 family insertion sequence element accessory protein TnpB [Burkholderia ubonensis]|uniref:IS66 family insertion sequence element accessory protein TnpB n=1 Tax=Burkholderia ubonensis TaxID=101571 RepID=UPI003F74C32C